MKISELIKGHPWKCVGNPDTEVQRIVSDSRAIEKGDLFFPKIGFQQDGVQFIDQAIEKGACAIVVEKPIASNVPQIIAKREHDVLRALCLKLYNHPTKDLFVVGVTGTNGKTSTCHYIEAFLDHAGYIGTTQYRWPGFELDSKLTTPMYENLQYYFSLMRNARVENLVMECSSHGIELGRIEDIEFDICVFTNLTHEHLDFHQNMHKYGESKKKLFTQYLQNSSKTNKHAVINVTDPLGKQWVDQHISPNIKTYGLTEEANSYPLHVETNADGMKIKASIMGEKISFFMPTLGMYNVMNVLAAMTAAKIKGLPVEPMVEKIQNGVYVPGRLEKVSVKAPFMVLVDYAYTEDALRNVLSTLKPFRKNRIITVFGCGGDRDATRRPKMARAVYEVADQIIITTDNPRTEDPEMIIEEITKGIFEEPDYANRVLIEVDRKKAIAKALQIAQKDDIVLIAGKGHETYQEIHGVRYPFDDRKMVQEIWSSM